MNETRDEVLAALKRAGGRGASGEAIARDLSISRVAVAKHVKSLIQAGYDIEARHGLGYRLVSAPDRPLPAEVEPLLTDSLWTRLEWVGETGSTNDDARELAREGAPEGTIVLASRQRSGKGRLGRTWSSPEGGAYLSIILRPAVAPAELSSLALAIALGVARGLASLGVSARVKWPNDVLVGGSKIAGILLEMTAEYERTEWVVAGIGLNLTRPDTAAEDSAAYVSDYLAVGAAATTARVLDAVGVTYRQWCAKGFHALRAEFESLHTLTGAQVEVRDASGAIRSSGRVVGVDDDGRLLLDAEGGRQAVSAGEVTLRRPH